MAFDGSAEQTGIDVILTPIQLAAILQQGTIHRASTLSNRFWGATSVIGGAAEMVASVPLWLAPEPTLTTKLGAGLLTYMGADVASTGARQVWTGQRTITLSAEAVRTALQRLGVDPKMADRLGRGANSAVNLTALIAAPLSIARTADAVRVAEVDRGLIDLEVEETFPGAHTIAKHVGRTIDQLKARLAAESRRAEVSSFKTLEDAEKGVSDVIRARSIEIGQWASRAQPGATASFTSSTSIAGMVMSRSGSIRESSEVFVLLKKIMAEGRVYYVLTSYLL